MQQHQGDSAEATLLAFGARVITICLAVAMVQFP